MNNGTMNIENMKNITDELNDTMALLEQQGFTALLCNAMLPVSSCPVKCGIPTEPGDTTCDYIAFPKALVGNHPEILVPASGDSMQDAGYDDGDLLRIIIGQPARDGDDVLACLDGECTVKTLFTDDDGQHWLVPRNENYQAILLSDHINVRMLGVVRAVEKLSPRASFRDCSLAVQRTKKAMAVTATPCEARVDAVICRMGGEVRQARQWYAVMRALIDRHAQEEATYALFCQRVCRLLPTHAHLPTAKELQRMAVQSFAKPVTLWNRHNAPVGGIRFDEYLRLARHTVELLDE